MSRAANGMKVCSRCGKDRPVDAYLRDARASDGLQSACRTCGAAHNRTYRLAHQDQVKASKKRCYIARHEHYKGESRRYYADHRDEVLAGQRGRYHGDEEFRQRALDGAKAWYAENSDHARERIALWQRENRGRINAGYRNRRLTDEEFRLSENMRARIRRALRGKEGKSARTAELIGCSAKELKLYLEAAFRPEMSWDNYGLYGWHVDHIIPCAVFDLTDPVEQKQCFHYTNLQPLWAAENLAKGPKVAA